MLNLNSLLHQLFLSLNSLLQSQLFSSLAGTVIGGLITLFVTVYSINKQFKNQISLNIQLQNEEKRKALLAIYQEIDNNKVLTYKALDIMQKSGTENGIKIPEGWIEFERFEWNNFKSIFLLASDDEELISKISWLYYQFSVCNSTKILTKDTANQILEVCAEVEAKLNRLLTELNNKRSITTRHSRNFK